MCFVCFCLWLYGHEPPAKCTEPSSSLPGLGSSLCNKKYHTLWRCGIPALYTPSDFGSGNFSGLADEAPGYPRFADGVYEGVIPVENRVYPLFFLDFGRLVMWWPVSLVRCLSDYRHETAGLISVPLYRNKVPICGSDCTTAQHKLLSFFRHFFGGCTSLTEREICEKLTIYIILLTIYFVKYFL